MYHTYYISLVFHIYPHEKQEHRPVLQFWLLDQISIIGPSWKTGQKLHWAHNTTETQLDMSPMNMLIMKNQVPRCTQSVIIN